MAWADGADGGSMAVLDNPVWHALRGLQPALGVTASNTMAARFDPDVSIFGAVEDLTVAAWAGFADVVAEGDLVATLRRDAVAAPTGWKVLATVGCRQYVAGERLVPAPDDVAFEALTEADGPEMLELVELTEPGPFRARTAEMGRYIGQRSEGRLVAMAGERLRLPGWTEVSAVCVDPEFRRRGLGAAMTLLVTEAIRARGDNAFLHVGDENEGAMALYERLGFEHRCDIVIAVLRHGGRR